jgi:hypothetical protein
VAGGAGEGPAKVPSPALCVRFPIAPPLGRAFARLASECSIKKRTETSPRWRRLPVCAVSVCVDSAARSGSSECVRAMLLQVNRG